ncbi:MAG: DUF2330 domain-containing protein [Sandaracinaceae bacterium]|nr:DUF2330 domain-containing protein [Sandaracinaceae bacterium]
MTKRLCVALCACALAGLPLAPAPAAACGGFFMPPTGSPSPVTRHRMAISMSMHETTLWDQIQYEGAPEDFVWVLPVAGGVPVELADNAFFEALEQHTTIVMEAPLPPRTFCNDPCGGFFGAAAESGDFRGGPMSGEVTVHHQGAIGPYETATIGSDDPDALVAWLREHHYGVPDEVLPIIAHYTAQGLDFAVLRLSSNFGVDRMQPVRVTVPGFGTSFPLRMVAAGVEGSVGLELFVFGEGRYGPMNFASAEVDRDALTYDWASGTFDYEARYAAAQATADGRVWITEFAAPAPASIGSWTSVSPRGEYHYAAEDWRVATRHVPDPYLTRLTADLRVEHLDEDLILGAVAGGDLEARIRVTRELNRARDVACPTTCTEPYGAGGTLRGDGRGDGLCATSPARPGPWGLSVVLALAGLALALRRR